MSMSADWPKARLISGDRDLGLFNMMFYITSTSDVMSSKVSRRDESRFESGLPLSQLPYVTANGLALCGHDVVVRAETHERFVDAAR